MKHTIELNGKHYDAVSGELVGHSNGSGAHSALHASTQAKQHQSKTTLISPTTTHKHSLARHKVNRSRTLMRTIVKKPVIRHSSAGHPAHPHFVTIAKIHNDASRIARINQIPKSKLVTKFGPLTHAT